MNLECARWGEALQRLPRGWGWGLGLAERRFSRYSVGEEFPLCAICIFWLCLSSWRVRVLPDAVVDTVAVEDVVSAAVVDIRLPVVAEALAVVGMGHAVLPAVVVDFMAVEDSGTVDTGTVASDTGLD